MPGRRPDGLRQLRETITAGRRGNDRRSCAARRARAAIASMSSTIAGNTTMQQLLCGVDCSPLGEVPFAPATGRGSNARPRNWASTSTRAASRWSCRSSADSWAATPWRAFWPPAWPTSKGPTLLVDIGTNGEIVLLADGKLSAASTAAGPAFEGARISCGMRGCTGAIEKVVVDDRLRINVIGNVPPAGLCGSGLIDAAAELLRHGLLTPQGRLLPPDQLPADVLPDLAERIVMHEKQTAFLLASESEIGRRPADPCLRSATSASCNWPRAPFARASSSSCTGPGSSRRTCKAC